MKTSRQQIAATITEDKLKKRLYIPNEYGYSHQHFDQVRLTQQEYDYLKERGLKDQYDYGNGKTVPIHPMCISCQARHIIKYKDKLNVNEQPFQIRCKGVPGQLPPEADAIIKRIATEKNMTYQRAYQLVAASIDPVVWAELMFGFDDATKDTEDPWYLRPYQKEQLRCTARRMALRQGRRTGKSFGMALKLLHLALTMVVSKGRDSEGNEVKTGPQIIITTPFQAQLENIFTEMERLLKRNVDLTNRVTSEHNGTLYVKTPFFKMTFDNGGIISGFVTGVEIRQDGSAGGSLRGQSGHVIYIDEMDMVPEDVLNKVIIPILFTSSNTMFFASSTPIGKAGAFRQLCKERADFKEDYLPSTVLPHWNTEKKELGKIDPQDDAFVAEYMADFVESNLGVFKADYVYGAMSNYEYEDSRPKNHSWYHRHKNSFPGWPNLFTCIGIDWNKNAGSEFVVVRVDPTTREFWVVDAVNVAPSKFSSITFKEEVHRLNLKWAPADKGELYIYADEGYGHHIIDDLLYGAQEIRNKRGGGRNYEEQQAALLLDRLKKFNFSQKVDLTNPLDGTIFQRTGKEFLVENAVRVFESGKVYFPASDDTLKNQLLNYMVIRRHASNGRPVYGMRSEKVGDHRLDALMLALGGLFLETDAVYSLSARMGMGTPGLIEKETLENRYNAHNTDPEEYFGIQPGGHFELLKIQRNQLADPDEPKPSDRVSKLELPKVRSDFGKQKNPTTIMNMINQKYVPESRRSVDLPHFMGQQESPFATRQKRSRGSRSSF